MHKKCPRCGQELLAIVEKSATDYTSAALEAVKYILAGRGISYKEAQPLMRNVSEII